MSNSIHGSLVSRLIAVETERRETSESRKELMVEMKKLPKHERKGILLRVKWHFESEEQSKDRQMAFDFAESLSESAISRRKMPEVSRGVDIHA